MTDNEIRQTLRDVLVLTNSMDKEHLTKMLQILLASQYAGSDANLFCVINLRKNVKKHLNKYLDSNHLLARFNHKQIKQIYAIMGDYGHYPVCKLCGKPIYINSETVRNPVTQRNNKEFSWDHIYPKSLGGANDLSNMQAAHKICNNHKGSNLPEEHAHCQINILVTIRFDDCLNTNFRNTNRNTKKPNPVLRKQDAWCHKHKKRHFDRYCGR